MAFVISPSIKSVVMIGGGIQEVEAVRIAKGLGFFTIVTDRDKSAACFEHADLAVNLDGKDVKGIADFINLNKKQYNIRGVFTCVNLGSTVAMVADRCGLPGVNPVAACLGDNKIKQKSVLANNGIPTPKHLVVESPTEALAAYQELGPSVVVKPADSFGGQGVSLVTDPRKMEPSFFGALRYSDFRAAIVEEAVTGHFVDLEGIFLDGNFYPLAILDSYFTTRLPGSRLLVSPLEYKNVYPSVVPNQLQDELFAMTENAARVLGINFGPVATDMIITDRGPMLIEISARLHGVAVNLHLIPRVSGIHPVRVLIKAVTNQKINKTEMLPNFTGAGVNKCLLPRPGVIKSIDGFEKVKGLPGLAKAFVFKDEGAAVDYRNSADIPAMIMVVGKDYPDAERRLEFLESNIRFETVPGN